MKTPFAKLILIVGTPGVGKTTVARKLAHRVGYDHVDLSRLVMKEHLYSRRDRARQTLVVDQRRLGRRLKHLLGTATGPGFVISTHYLGEYIPFKNVSRAFVIRLDPSVLSRRLLRRRWRRKKVWENVEAELVDSCLHDAVKYLERRKIAELDSTGRNTETLVRRMTKSLSVGKTNKPRLGQVDWLRKYDPEILRRRLWSKREETIIE